VKDRPEIEQESNKDWAKVCANGLLEENREGKNQQRGNPKQKAARSS
jgi:hypothetical protein